MKLCAMTLPKMADDVNVTLTLGKLSRGSKLEGALSLGLRK